MKNYTEFFNDKGNIRPATRALVKADGIASITSALSNAGLDVSVDTLGSLLVAVGNAEDGTTIYIRLDAVVTTAVR